MKTKVSADGLVEMSGGNFLEMDSGKVYDRKMSFLFKMIKGDDHNDTTSLADFAATYDAQCISAARGGETVQLRDRSFNTYGEDEHGEQFVIDNPRAVKCTGERWDDSKALFASPQGDLAPSDVHIARGLQGYAAGYTLADGVADIAAPPFLVPNQSDKFWTWTARNAFAQVNPIVASTGSPPEVNASLGNTPFQVTGYALGAFLPTELQANADAPLNIMQKIMRVVMDKLKLARELRVQTLLQTSGNWNSNLVNTVLSANRWDNGPGADPIADLKLICEQSYMAPTDMIMSELLYDWLVRSPAVQKYFYAKDGSPQLPSPEEFSAMFKLPKLTVANIKYLPTAAGAIQYVWGNHVVLLRSTAALATQQDVATCRTFRWTGASTSDGGAAVGGWLVRTYFDQKRGARGGTAIVVSHYDAEVITSNLVGGLVLNAYQ